MQFGLILCFLLGMIAWAQADEKIVTLSSLEWPPYTGQSLPDLGSSSLIAKAAFKAMGYTLKIEFYPWSRAVLMAKKDQRIAGYFPEYDSDDVRSNFYLSDPVGSSPLGLAQRRGEKHDWQSITDLAHTKLGIVQDYVNTAELDTRIAQKQQLTDVALTDAQNLLKLSARRIDLAVIDKNVFSYLLHNNLKALDGKLDLQGKLLEDKKLFICFKQTPEGEKMQQIFNAGLKKIDVHAIMKQYCAAHRISPADCP